ncbi:hypothetical protein DC081_06575 [Ignatzschineria cameli]|uniref:DUF2644 domain-containing protein n=3 Tax=Bacteria TaxID=2 RepID=A0A2U2AQC8_9GAMM|nr:hypothetical protein DC077_07240 [Ignatzschineria cameli]PWD89447.1 hypothetical protein DC079_06865 [Ignatzschineria cameli]PWD90919.1 hypothetical protein DC081_06575 [Ignatzschineria cameli]PWD91707.1 hypothetical protein DC078_06860 [Ignatzschineria cameli]
MTKELLRMLQSRSSDGKLRLDLNKTTLFMTSVAGILLTTYAVIVQASFAEALFITMIGAGAGTTISKGVVDTMQKRKDHE